MMVGKWNWKVQDRTKPIELSAVTGTGQAADYQNGRDLAARTSPLATRRLDTEWVIGQQGNINGEFWKGGMAEIRIYNRDLTDLERRFVEAKLANIYNLKLSKPRPADELKPEVLALASLCHALLNSNEFLFVD